MQDLMWD
jgi:hypothetical protein